MTRLHPLAALVSASMTALALGAGGALADDSGDAPDSYGLATHATGDTFLRLGNLPGDDNPAVFSLGADADDNDGTDDEDGVFAFPVLVQNGKAYTTNVFATNTGPGNATLAGWVDVDGNGRFDADEGVTVTVPAGTRNGKFKLTWPDLSGVSTDFTGDTYARFRVTSDAIGVGDATGTARDGEVEDYPLAILPDADNDERPDGTDPDDDNDGIPDEVEVIGRDTDGDGRPDYLDGDSDNDGIADFVEAGPVPASPTDTDGDGTPDYLDLDSDNDGRPDADGDSEDSDGDGMNDAVEGDGDTDRDGVADRDDLDADNDGIPDAIERGDDAAAPRDTDGDGVPDMRDLDSDNDGIPDLYESNSGEVDVRPLDADANGRIDGGSAFGPNGLSDALETEPESGIPRYAVSDADNDGTRDYRDLDSDNDGLSDVLESGALDADGNGIVDALIDSDGDGLPDVADVDATGGVDSDDDGIDDSVDSTVNVLEDLDGDGIGDAADLDRDGDGVIDGSNARAGGELPDGDDDGLPAFQDGDDDGTSAATDGGDDGDGGADDGAGDGGSDDAGSDDAGIDDAGTGDGGADGATGGTTGGTTDDGGDGGSDDGGTDGSATGGTTDGATDGGFTTGVVTTTGTTTGATTGGLPSDDDPEDPRIETGLSGGAGCSIGEARAADPLFGLALFGAIGALWRRRRPGASVAGDPTRS